MVVRTQISLDSEVHLKAKRKAAGMGVSLAQYFRTVIGRDLAEPADAPDVTAVFDLGTSGISEVSENVDRYVGEAVDEEYPGSLSAGQTGS